MPRGQKSKLRAREKRRQAHAGNQNLVGAQATAASQELQSSCSRHFKDVHQGSRAAGTPNTQPGPQRAPSTSTPAVAISYSRSNEGANNQEEEILSSSQAQAVIAQLHRDPLYRKVVLMVYYLLYKYQMKEPITKGEMLRNVIQMYRNHFPEILRRASEHLELIFGLDVKEVDPHRHTYILVNKLELSDNERLSDDSGFPKTGFLMNSLGLIFMKGNSATGQQIWEMLNMMGVYAGWRHFIYGEPRKLILDLVQEEYLEYRQVPNSDPPCYEFLWGPRAHAETSKMKVLEFWAKVYNSVPSAFPAWYEEAVRDEEERARARAAARARISAMASARSRAMSSSSSCPECIEQESSRSV
ncbi:melanoma-associated antigen B10-like [Choloepus didactylus]|uniref:melanoma-associated antigen B10-like n=1 Tax=Choloepus didactylus TaxID=27675 RepID=UPI00189F998A|nr:melanoma-associated antigen B10-like [Choloepus didactylus]